MTLQLFHSEFPYIWGKFDFLFYQCMVCQLLLTSCQSERKTERRVPSPLKHMDMRINRLFIRVWVVRKERMERVRHATSGLCSRIKDWNTVGGNQQVEELTQHHTDPRRGGGRAYGGMGGGRYTKTLPSKFQLQNYMSAPWCTSAHTPFPQQDHNKIFNAD